MNNYSKFATEHTLTKSTLAAILVVTIGLAMTTPSAQALPADDKKSLLDNDPDVIYLNQYLAKPIKFIAIDYANAYSSKKGKTSRKLATFKPGDELELVAMTANAYRVSGKGKHGKVTAWVSPKTLANKDPKFVANLKLLYDRQITVNKLITANEVAIGMTIDEVSLSLGQPTKKTSKVTKDGISGSWEFITYEEQKHYNYITDPISRQVYKQVSHITTEEKSKITVEFANNLVTSVTTMEDNGPGKIRIVNPPIIFGF